MRERRNVPARTPDYSSRTPDEWRDAMRIWSPKKFLELDVRSLNTFNIEGKNAQELAAIFGVDTTLSPALLKVHLAHAFWPDDTDVVREWTCMTRTADDWRNVLEDAGWTSEKLAALAILPADTLRFDGKSILSIASLLGIPFQGNRVTVDFLRSFCSVLWSRTDAVPRIDVKEVRTPDYSSRTPDEWRDAMRVWSPKKFLALDDKGISIFKIHGKNAQELAGIFGIDTTLSPALLKVHLAHAFWPDDTDVVREWTCMTRTADDWRNVLEDAGWTPEKWAAIRVSVLGPVRFDGKSLLSLASLLGISYEGDKITTDIVHRVGLALWPDAEIIQRAIAVDARTPDAWRVALQDAGWTPEKWIAMGDQDALGFSLDGKGLTALASLFSFSENPLASRIVRLRFGLCIWSDSPALLSAIRREEEKLVRETVLESRTKDAWRVAIERAGWTREKFLQQTMRALVKFSVDGWGFVALASVFDVSLDERNPISVESKEKLADKIWSNKKE